MTQTETLGLRERKRIETREQLEHAAVDIATRDGLEHATVDAISAAVNVSPRTFFNYFDSKEDAILGVRDTEITDEMLAEHAARFNGADIVASLIPLLFSILGPTLANSNLQHSRMELVRRYPHLMVRQVAQLTRMSEQLTSAITSLLARDAHASELRSDNSPKNSTGSDAATAEILLALCGGAFRVAIKEWMATGGAGTREELETRAISLVREVIEKIQ